MRTIIHDLEKEKLINLKGDYIILPNESINNSIGCFSCWLKTPLKCVFKDCLCENSNTLLNSDELIIISKNVNGCYSSKVKKVLERSISYVEPFFTLRNGEIHHKLRSDKRLKLTVYFYGNFDGNDKLVINELLNANKKNFDNESVSIHYIDGEIKELII